MKIDKRKEGSDFKMGIDQMRQIKGGAAESRSASFDCTCVGKDGKAVKIKASSVEECWNACK